jgi:hypothetical protein
MPMVHFSIPNSLHLGCTAHITKLTYFFQTHFCLVLFLPRELSTLYTSFICLLALETPHMETPLKSAVSFALPFTHDLRIPFRTRLKNSEWSAFHHCSWVCTFYYLRPSSFAQGFTNDTRLQVLSRSDSVVSALLKLKHVCDVLPKLCSNNDQCYLSPLYLPWELLPVFYRGILL